MRRDAFMQNDQADDIRNLVLVGQRVFRARFAGVWPIDGDHADVEDN